MGTIERWPAPPSCSLPCDSAAKERGGHALRLPAAWLRLARPLDIDRVLGSTTEPESAQAQGPESGRTYPSGPSLLRHNSRRARARRLGLTHLPNDQGSRSFIRIVIDAGLAPPPAACKPVRGCLVSLSEDASCFSEGRRPVSSASGSEDASSTAVVSRLSPSHPEFVKWTTKPALAPRQKRKLAEV